MVMRSPHFLYTSGELCVPLRVCRLALQLLSCPTKPAVELLAVLSHVDVPFYLALRAQMGTTASATKQLYKRVLKERDQCTRVQRKVRDSAFGTYMCQFSLADFFGHSDVVNCVLCRRGTCRRSPSRRLVP